MLSLAAHGLFAGAWTLVTLVDEVTSLGVKDSSPVIAMIQRAPAQELPQIPKPILQTEVTPLPLLPVDPVETLPQREALEPAIEEPEPLDPLLEETRFEELSLEPLAVEEEEAPASEEREAVEEEPVGEEALPVRALLESPEVSYPRAAYLRKHEGTVVLLMVVSPDGLVAEVEVIESSGHRLLDRAALIAARGYRFEAGEESMTVNKSFTFRLP